MWTNDSTVKTKHKHTQCETTRKYFVSSRFMTVLSYKEKQFPKLFFLLCWHFHRFLIMLCCLFSICAYTFTRLYLNVNVYKFCWVSFLAAILYILHLLSKNCVCLCLYRFLPRFLKSFFCCWKMFNTHIFWCSHRSVFVVILHPLFVVHILLVHFFSWVRSFRDCMNERMNECQTRTLNHSLLHYFNFVRLYYLIFKQ